MNLPRVRPLAIAMLLMTSVSSLGFQQRSAAPPISADLATVNGIVVSADAVPQPLRRAIVTIRSNQAIPNRSAITDDDGRFVIRQAPAGRAIITATKPGYVAAAYGAMRPNRPGTPVALVAGLTLEARIVMSRAAAMTGIVRDDRGQPVQDVRVFAIDARQPAAPSPARPLSGTSVITDDRGVFRLFDVVPGEYVIAAVPAASPLNGEIARRSEAATEALLARLQNRSAGAARTPSSSVAPADNTAPATLAPVYFPGTPALSSAGRIQVSSGDVREGLDFTLMSVPVTTIEGVLVSAGPFPPAVRLLIEADSSLQFPGLNYATPRLDQRLDDGRFKYSMVTPGHYVITARADKTDILGAGRGRAGAGPPPPPPPPTRGADGPATLSDTLYGVEEVDVTGAPVSGVTVRLQPGARISGRLRFDSVALAAPADLTTVRVGLQVPESVGYTPVRFATNQSTALAADGTFLFAGIAPGRYNVQVTMPANAGSGWWLRSVIVGERDVLDTGLDVVLGVDVSGVLTMTDRRTELSGTLQSAAGQPAPEYFVIVMPADPVLRTKGSRRIKTTRPSSDGRFAIGDLPPGDYLLIALTDVEPNEWQQPDFLASIANAGIRISIGEGEKKRQDLRIEK